MLKARTAAVDALLPRRPATALERPHHRLPSREPHPRGCCSPLTQDGCGRAAMDSERKSRGRAESVLFQFTAVSQLLYPEAADAKWLFHQEKATFRNCEKWLHELWNRSSAWGAGSTHLLKAQIESMAFGLGPPGVSTPSRQRPAQVAENPLSMGSLRTLRRG